METHLTIKHLAPYLPFGLKFLHHLEIYSLDGLYVNGDAFDADSGEIPFEHCKPILRPLSDFNYSWGYPNKEMFYEDVKNKTITVKLLEELLEDHIDVFGLIEKGLAIDINELKH